MVISKMLLRFFHAPVVFFCLVLVAGPIGASTTSRADRLAVLLEQAQERALWSDSEWLNLLHARQAAGIFRFGGFGKAGYDSYVDDSRFFLSDRGATDPEAELEAALDSSIHDDQLRAIFTCCHPALAAFFASS